jgi:hypothetical protein
MPENFKGNFQDVMFVQELRGEYPNIALAPDVSYNDLIAGDDNPMFLTLPIGKVGAISGNGRYYDEDFVKELERQTLQNKPIGLMGHLKAEDRATAFPAEAVHWVGVQRIGELLWGKGYVPPGESRERIRRYKAQGKKIATSIAAFAEGQWDATVGALRMMSNTLRLDQIDIAPADRAGISDLAFVPILTTEMETDPPKETIVDKLDVINALTVEDARLLPDAVRQAVLSTVKVAPEVALVNEMRSELGLSTEADLVQTIKELRQAEALRKQSEVKNRLLEMAAPDAPQGIKLETVRELVIEMVTMRNPQTVQEAESAYAQVLDLPSVKKTLAATVVQEMGPNHGAPIQGQAPTAGKYFIIPKQEAN